MINTKKILITMALFVGCLGFSQKDHRTETIIFPQDSLEFYMNKYKESSKSIKMTPIKAMRVSYIYLDGSKLNLSKINELRKRIISDYGKGRAFADLANNYTMDIAKDGDLNWFNEGTMVKEFEDAVKKHKKGDIFTLDIPNRNWYYVVLKTYDDVKKVKMEVHLAH